jgi:GT2 family glycosyltransferase
MLKMPSTKILSVLYVVRNEEKFIEKSIRSIYEIADEIVVVDTGSCDTTLQICRRFRKVRIFTHPWVHDFSKSKNHGLRQCSGQWVLCMDADEMLDEQSASSVRSAVMSSKPNVLGYGIHIVDHEDEWGPLADGNVTSFFPSPQVRLFRLGTDLQFDGKVSESVNASILRKNGGIDILEACIHHHLWKGRGREYASMKLNYYNKLGADYDLLGEGNIQEKSEPAPIMPKVGIVMACFNALLHTKECLDSIHEHTKVPYELFVVDNGSTDGTFAELSATLGKNVMRSERNLGVAKARNMGATEALKDPAIKYVCFVDNDIRVSPDWLSKMVRVLEDNGQVGIVAPLSSVANGAQNVSNQYPRKDAATIVKEIASREPPLVLVEEVDRFCMLVRASVLGQIGLFDDSFGIYGYEELDFCKRARQAGIEIAMANRAYVEHKGGTTIYSNQMNLRQLLLASSSRFFRKWKPEQDGIPNDAGKKMKAPVSEVPKSIVTANNLVARRADAFTHPRTAVIVLTCNRLDVTRECINSLLKYTSTFDLIVVDNGSSDGTFEWLSSRKEVTVIRNDRNIGIPKARNQGIRASSAEYLVLMDNDIVVSRGWLDELFSAMGNGYDVVGIEAWKLGLEHQPTAKCVNQGESFDYLGGACCLFKRKVFEEAGLLDEGFSPAYYEDCDISVRSKKLGFKLGWHSTLKIHHKEHQTLIHGQKDFNYQEQLSKSYVRFRDKMNGDLTVEHEKLAPLDRKLKILYLGMLYDYGEPSRGNSFEHDNFFPSLSEWGRTKELVHFDYVSMAREHGVPEMSRMLLDVVYREMPDVLFGVFFNEQHDPRRETLLRISEKTPTVTIGWFCDSHWRYENFDKPWAGNLGFCVTTSTVAYQKYVNDGFREKVIKSQWGASPKYVKIEGIRKDVDVSFVGQPHGNRRAMIQALQHAGIDVKVYGTGWGQRLSFEEMVRMFNRSKINLNLNNACDARSKQIKGRNFEVPACGGFLLTEKAENLNEYYKYGSEIETYENVDGLINSIKYYLKHEGRREEIAKAGYERTMGEHTYSHRYNHIFSRAGLL